MKDEELLETFTRQILNIQFCIRVIKNFASFFNNPNEKKNKNKERDG